MRRLALGATLVLAIGAAAFLFTGASARTSNPYDVRAIFDNASEAVTGEEIRIAGAPVGTIVAEDVTADKRAAVTLQIDKPAFTPFHADATCSIRVQSLIGEKYVDCTPGTSPFPALSLIRHGPGSGAYLLPVTHTSSPVDFDLVQDIYRDPVRQQLALILNELGTALAARGSDLAAVIRRADPALGNTDQVLKILARQNRQLAQLASDSSAVLTPLARAKKQLADFIVQANRTSVASAARAADIARSFQLLPSFLRQLRPLMVDLGDVAQQGTPVFAALSQAAPAINRQYQLLAPFAARARTALIQLGASAAQQQPALVATIPLARRLKRLGEATAPAAISLDRLTASLKQTGGIQQLMALLFYGTSAVNGFDADGHFIRTEALVGGCTPYSKAPVAGCSANFAHTKAAADQARALSGGDPKVARVVQASIARSPGRSQPGINGLLSYLIGQRR